MKLSLEMNNEKHSCEENSSLQTQYNISNALVLLLFLQRSFEVQSRIVMLHFAEDIEKHSEWDSLLFILKRYYFGNKLRKTITDALNIKCSKQANHLLPTSNSEQRSIAYLTTINFDTNSSHGLQSNFSAVFRLLFVACKFTCTVHHTRSMINVK